MRPCKLDPYVEYVNERIAQARPEWIPATVLLRELMKPDLNPTLDDATVDPDAEASHFSGSEE